VQAACSGKNVEHASLVAMGVPDAEPPTMEA